MPSHTIVGGPARASWCSEASFAGSGGAATAGWAGWVWQAFDRAPPAGGNTYVFAPGSTFGVRASCQPDVPVRRGHASQPVNLRFISAWQTAPMDPSSIPLFDL